AHGDTGEKSQGADGGRGQVVAMDHLGAGPSIAKRTLGGARERARHGKALAALPGRIRPGVGNTIAIYDVTPEGRFLMLRREAQGANLRMVLNGAEELKRALAKGGAPTKP